KKIYKDIFWEIQNASNKKVLNDNLAMIKSTEKVVIQRLTDLTKQFWPGGKVRVDIVYYAKSSRQNMNNRPYTSIFPTHVVMNSAGDSDRPFGNWLELLYHESSHPLILSSSGFVSGTIMDVAETSGAKPLRSLWHAYLFYFSGVVSKQALETQGIKNYEMYMVRNNVFGWYLPYLEKYLPAYVNKTMTLKDATELIFQDYKKK
ncbi:MAG: hypothetical protein KDB79_06200, partial [Acidobacteria bacterium]|nr:hypothetical protein [Acidobacteriota bacterium]